MSALDRSIRRRLVLGFAAGWVSKLSTVLIQLVQVPVLLHFWGVPLYGEWLLLNAIPIYLSLANVGFATVAVNEMTMLVARGDRAGALRSFQSCWWLIALLLGGVGALVAAALWWIDDARALFGLSLIGEGDTRWILLLLGVSVLAGQLEQLYHAAYQSVGRFAYGQVVKTAATLLVFASTMAAVALGATPLGAAIAYTASSVLFTVALGALLRHDLPWIDFGWQHARRAEIRRLVRPALGFVGFPIGVALNIQGTLLVIGWTLGPTAVAVFGTARTLSRVALQLVQIVNNAVAGELSMAFGADDFARMRTLHRLNCQLALVLATVIVAAVLLLSPWFLRLWTGGRIPPDLGLLALLMVGGLLGSLWSTSSTTLYATNNHLRLSACFLFATVTTVVLCVPAAQHGGLWGVAAALLFSDLLMTAYVLPRSIALSRDSGRDFVRSQLDFAPLLGALRTLFERLGRRRAAAAVADAPGPADPR
ncbi:MAG TPA: lipopolysaccharide biosynthesis protein [Methylibium sp.]|uniref:lipopolysaccharide biosynthesis protein n=1 Tax=Methylibium sp. TaxID=2067992 RepID=UPI002DBA0678|nr:lipopolysaccharide biosynthesis protein [Methylibium sp.]HEU4460747.1 lipopolysaccharide biosynthesis protein [Methylibium sp.]